MSTAAVLVPTAITAAMITAATPNVEDPGTAWVSGGAVAIGETRWRATTHRVYRRLTVGPANSTPPEDDTAGNWSDAGPTNRFAMFDNVVSTQTVNPTTVSVTLRPGFFNALALSNVDGANVAITVRDKPASESGSVVVRSYSAPLEASMPGDWYEYFFGGFRPQTDLVLTDIPINATAEVVVTVTAATGVPVKIGVLAVGDMRPLGQTLADAQASSRDFSYEKVNEFGDVTTVKRRTAKNMTLSAIIALEDANGVADTLADLASVPCLWIGSTDPRYTSLRCFGKGRGDVTFPPGQTFARLNLTVEGRA